jgi:multicomponent Na+:H+ antiporter subunit D
LFFIAIILTIGLNGTSNYIDGGIFAKYKLNPWLVISILLLFMFGVAKVALMPLHKWLPSAMVAPTPVSALLHAVAVVKSGAFILFKIFVFIFGISYLKDVVNTLFSFNYLIIIPSITIILASIIALFQNNLKKRLAYSTISQLSYIVLSLCILTPTSAYGGFLHIIAHAFSKIALFFAAGSILVLAHKENIDELSGIGRYMPITMITFSIGALSLIGFPLTIGFISKWFLISGIFDSKNYIPLFVIILSTLLNAMYFVPIIFKAFFEGPKDTHQNTYKKSISMDIALIITSICVIGFNIYSGFLVSLVIN